MYKVGGNCQSVMPPASVFPPFWGSPCNEKRLQEKRLPTSATCTCGCWATWVCYHVPFPSCRFPPPTPCWRLPSWGRRPGRPWAPSWLSLLLPLCPGMLHVYQPVRVAVEHRSITVTQFYSLNSFLSSVVLMTCIGCLTNIAKQRPSNMSTVVQTYELLHGEHHCALELFVHTYYKALGSGNE